MKYLQQFLKQHRGKVALALALLLGQVVGTLLIPALVATLVDKGILAGNAQFVWQTGLQMLAVALLGAGVAVCGSWVTSDLGARFGREMRSKLLAKSQQISIQQFEELGVSSMLTRTTSDITNLQQTMGMALQLVVPAPLIIAVSIVMTGLVSPVMALIQFGFLVLLVAVAALVIKKSNKLSASIQRRMDAISRILREGITGVRVVRAFGNEGHEQTRAEGAYAAYADNMIRLNKLFAVFSPIVWMAMGLLIVVVLGVGGALTLGGGMAVGQITAVIEYSVLTISYLLMAASVLTQMPKAHACMQRLGEVFDAKPAVRDELARLGYPPPAEARAAVEFKDVSFAYPGAAEPVLHGLRFSLKKGQTTAVIGSTGAGKSTLADLLLRLHDAQSGQILLGGADIGSLTQQELRARIGYVPQKAFLFSGTIAQNLRMGRANASDEELWAALRVAQAEGFVKKLPLGLEAPVAQGGANFSGGQRQRLAIARALIKKADVFVFDDSFSALDVKTDAALRKALREKVTESAKLVIAQRVSTIRDAQQILVLDEGRTAGLGTHEQLLQNCPVYAAIAQSQMV